MIDEDKKALLKVIKEISNAMARKQGEQELITESIKENAKKYGIEVKVLRKITKTYFKQNLTQEVEEMEDFKHTYETLFGREED